MKTRKRILAAVLALASAAAFAPVTAFAEDTTTLNEDKKSGTTNVSYKVEAGYTVTIPASVSLSEGGQGETIAFSNVKLAKGEKISVTLEDAANKNLSDTSDFNVAQTDKTIFAAYTVTDDDDNAYQLGEEVASFEYNGNPDSETTCPICFTAPKNAQYAGTYTDQLTFKISVEDAVAAAVPISSISIPETLYLSTQYTNEVASRWAVIPVTFDPDNATDQTVTWTSDDEFIATVDSNGKVTAINPGTATITATTANGKTATCTVSVDIEQDLYVVSKKFTYVPGMNWGHSQHSNDIVASPEDYIVDTMNDEFKVYDATDAKYVKIDDIINPSHTYEWRD